MPCLPSRLLPILLFSVACAACSSSPTRGVLSETPRALPENVPAAAFSTCKKADWPPSALMRKEQGVTSLALLVGADGKLRQAEVIASSGSAELDSAAKAMMSSCRFVPAIVRGVPVERWVETVYVWSIDDDGRRPSALVRQLSDRAALGQADAQYALYLVLGEDEEYAAGDKAAALEGLLRHSAQGGYCPAKFSLGQRYAQGNKTARDSAQARDWFRQAALCGHPVAHQALEEMEAGPQPAATGK